MTDQLDALKTSIVAAVQQELTRFSQQVATEVQRLRDEIASERMARTKNEDQIRALLPAIERSQEANVASRAEMQRTFEARLAEVSSTTKRRFDEIDTRLGSVVDEAHLTEVSATSKRRFDEIEVRLGRVVDEANAGLAAAVESAARPVIRQVEHRQDAVEERVGKLDTTIRRFDVQASQLVQHVNAVTEATEARLEEVSGQLGADVDARLSTLAGRLDDVSAQAARQQAEVSNIVGARVDQSEDRINERILATEARVNEQLGQRIADIDAHVGRVGTSVDDAVTMLSDRLSGTDERFAEINAALADIDRRVGLLDVDAIDEMKDRVSSVAGEVDLVRIEMDRFKETIGEKDDTTTGRITEIETQLQEQHMEVETAVQLERLEEVERAIIALDPAQFVRRDEVGDGADPTSSNGSSDGADHSPGEASLTTPAFDPAVDVTS